MTLWDWADEHPVLFVIALLIIAMCINGVVDSITNYHILKD